MAILEKATNNYFKLDFDGCAVCGSKVFVKFSLYQSVKEREKEKERKHKWVEFFQRLRQYIQAQYNELFMQIETAGLTPEQILVQSEENKIDALRYPALRATQDKIDMFESYEKDITDCRFCLKESKKQSPIISDGDLTELTILGFDIKWITDPIILCGGAEVYVGNYNGEPITLQFYYNRLKTVMGETQDC